MELSFLEQTRFSRVREELFEGDENFRHFQNALMRHPRTGDVIAGTNGARQVRFGDPTRGKGKRGGIRVIYFYHEATQQILLLFAYDKNTSDLTPAQRKEVAAIIAEFREAVQQPE
jgi:hypothetical protein